MPRFRSEPSRQVDLDVKSEQYNSMENSWAQFLSELKFNSEGLIVAIAQDYSSKKVLMQAWMNEAALIKTLETGKVTYYSRSRGQLWTKGESSGNWQKLVKIESDCDQDSLLITVEQHGPACHTNKETCFQAGTNAEIPK